MQPSDIVRQTLLTLHLIGLALGLGGAAIADFFFMKAVRMADRITPETVKWMRSVSQVVWAGIGVLSLSGIGLFLLQPSTYLASSGFKAKMVFVTILIINGLFLNFYTTARLTTFNFSQLYTRRDAAWKARKLSFIFGAVSAVSWYSALATAQFKSLIGLSFAGYLLVFSGVLFAAVSLALTVEYIMHTRRRPQRQTLDQLAAVQSIAPPQQAVTAQPQTAAPAIPQPMPLQPPPQLPANQPVVAAPPNETPKQVTTNGTAS